MLSLRLPHPRSAMRGLTVLALGVAPLAAMSAASASDADFPHPAVVSDNPADYTPRLVPTTAVPHPHVDAIGQAANGMMFAGGRFDKVADGNGNNAVPRQNFVVFDGSTPGAISPISPAFNNPVWAVETNGDDVWVGGEFTTVNGVSKPRLVKLNATTGQVVAAFKPGLTKGRVLDIEYYTGPLSATPLLIISGSFPGLLLALDPDTGAHSPKINLNVNTEVPGAFGSVSVNHFSVNPLGTKLVAVGNFTKVGTDPRPRAFMADLVQTGATLNPWKYAPFADTCRATTARRLAYLSDVDFAPDGSYFVVVATGFNPNVGDWGTHVCDAAARFDTNITSPTKPVWINYTGGDTIWSVKVTGAAVYVQGHFQFLNNIYGVNLTHDPNSGWVTRKGVGAIGPDSGKALGWNPNKPAQMGGKDFLATAAGLWIVSDSAKVANEPRYGIAFMPLP